MKGNVLIKFSGEAMAGGNGYGLDFKYIEEICLRIKKIHEMGVGIGIVCGGGNFLRGRDTKEMERVNADYVGMLATVMNSLVLKDAFTKLGIDVYNQSGLEVGIIDKVDSDKALQAINSGKIVIFGGGVGKPYFSTDTGASLRAKDIGASLIIKLTNVDGVYDKDPNKYKDAKRYGMVTYDEVLENKLEVMDLSAIEICRDNDIEIVVMNIDDEDGLYRLIKGGNVGTRVCRA